MPGLAHHQLVIAIVPRSLALRQQHLYQQLPNTDLESTRQTLAERLQRPLQLRAQLVHHELAHALRHLLELLTPRSGSHEA